MAVIHEVHARLVDQLEAAGVASAEAEAWQLLEGLTGSPRVELLLDRRQLEPGEERRLAEWVARRSTREPLQHILGRSWFYGLELQQEPGVLVPRPETERLVELTLEVLRDVVEPLIIDVGTGTGAVALALKSERPDAQLVASDISGPALELAGQNARRLQLDVRLISSDLLEDAQLLELAGRASAIVSNPPYLPDGDRTGASPEVRWDPPTALYSGADGLDHFGRLLTQANELLRPGAFLLVELDPRNVAQARERASDWAQANVLNDLTGRPRFLRLRR